MCCLLSYHVRICWSSRLWRAKSPLMRCEEPMISSMRLVSKGSRYKDKKWQVLIFMMRAACLVLYACFEAVLKHIIYISANNGQWWQSNLSGCQRLNPWEALQELQSPRLPSSLPSLVPSSKLPGDPVTIDVLPPVRDTDGPALVPGAAHVRVSLPLVDNSESRLSCFSSFCFDSFLFLVCLVLFALWYSNMYSIPSRRKWCGAAIWLHFTMKLEVGWCPLQLSFPWACN